MNTQKILRKQIVDFLLEYPILRGTPGCYDEVAKRFRTNKDYIRSIYKTLRFNGQVEDAVSSMGQVNEKGRRTFKENVKEGLADTTFILDRRITKLKDLIEVCEIDLKEWNIDWWECNKWEVGAKNTKGKIEVSPLFQVKAKLSKRKLDTDLAKQKEAILKELTRAFSPSEFPVIQPEGERLLEISIPDIHFGKLAWREETDEDYDIKIAEKRFTDAIEDLTGQINLDKVERILFPIGNDLINVDNRQNTTTAGTIQDTDCRFMKMIKAVNRILVKSIIDLSKIAPVDVVVVPGNHDTTTAFMIGEILAARFYNDPRVCIDNRPKLRKYYQYGKNSFQFTHGDQEKHSELGMIFAAEEAKLWAATDFRFCQLGHYHKNKKINWVSVDEFQGFQVQIMPSLSGTDFWHKSKGYNSNKGAKAFVYDKKGGIKGEFTYNVPK